MKKMLPVILVTALVAGGIMFYIGFKYGQNQKTTSGLSAQDRQQRFGQGSAGRGNRFGGATGGGFVSGEIISKDDKSITVKLRDGGSKIIFFSDSTKIMKEVDAKNEDLKVGDNVTGNGTGNQDGSINAQTLQLRTDMATTTP